jgi:hypothetical protein
MYSYLLFTAVLIIIGSFVYYLLSLMQLAPFYIAAPILFFSILLTVVLLSQRKKQNVFRGFRN